MATKEKWVTVNGKHMLVEGNDKKVATKKQSSGRTTGGSTGVGRTAKGKGSEKKQLAKIDNIDNLKKSKKK